jgi:hypothetical protein
MSITNEIKTTTSFSTSMESSVHLKLTDNTFSGILLFNDLISKEQRSFKLDASRHVPLFQEYIFNAYRREGVSMWSASKCLYNVGKNCFALCYYSPSTDDRLIPSCRPHCTKKCITVGTKTDIMLVICKQS